MKKSDSVQRLDWSMDPKSIPVSTLPSGNHPGLQLPSFFPDIQWIRVALNSDILFLADDVRFNRKSRCHRGKIRTPDGYQWIHIPMHPEDRSQSLSSARIDQRSDWFTPLWRSLEFNYRNSIYFEFYEPELLDFFENLRKCETYGEGFKLTLEQMQKWFEFKLPPLVWLTETNLQDNPIPAYVQAKIPLLTEAESRNYLSPLPISVYPDPNLPVYRQHFGGFEPNCCWLDLLFERGPDSWTYLDELKLSI